MWIKILNLEKSLFPTLKEEFRLAYQHYEESLKNYFTLVQSASPKELHKLRIGFKISRYAFDFLYDSGLKDSYEKIEESKELQDNLGKLHDLYNQIKLLTTLQKQKPSHALKTLIMERKRLLKTSKRPLNLFNPPLT
jgi:CHAD domain-containing protein